MDRTRNRHEPVALRPPLRVWLRLGMVAAVSSVVPQLACQPAPVTIDWIGDSNTVLMEGAGPGWRAGAPAGSDLVVDAKAGAVLSTFQPALAARVAGGRPEILVVAVGTNNARLGWGPADEADFVELLSTPLPSACVVVVLGGYGPTLEPATGAAIDAAKVRMRHLAQARPGTVVVDWGPVAEAHPEYLAPDGIHLASAAAVDAVADVAWDGVARCPQGNN